MLCEINREIPLHSNCYFEVKSSNNSKEPSIYNPFSKIHPLSPLSLVSIPPTQPTKRTSNPSLNITAMSQPTSWTCRPS